MLLNSLHIKGFRGFTDFKIDGLGQVNLIIGRNSAGKTSLLEAIYLLRARGGDPFTAINRAEDLLNSKLNLFNGRPAIDLRGEFTIESDQPTKVSVILVRSHIQLNGRNYVGLPPFRVNETPFAIPALSPVMIVPGMEGGVGIVQAWERILLTPKEEDVASCLRLIVPNLERVALIGKMPIVQLRDQPARVTMASLGDGVTRLFHLACGLVISSDEVCLVEEIESGVHHSVNARMWQFVFMIAQRHNVQVFATTHSLDCLRGFARASHELPDVVARVIRLDNHKGRVVPVMFDEEEFQVAAEEEIEIR